MNNYICQTCDSSISRDGLRCEFCGDCCVVLYEGWFYTSARLNPFAQGTADAGLLQKRHACKSCADRAKEVGMRP